MSHQQKDDAAWANTVHATAKGFLYPPTPDIAGSLRGRLRPTRRADLRLILARAAAVIVLLAVGLLAIPPLRAAVLEFLQIGGIRILLEPLDTPTPDFTLQEAVLYPSVETTLDAAQEQMPYAVRLPQYPPDLGEPDHVYLREADGVLALVWLEDADDIRLILYHLPPAAGGVKTMPDILQATSVNDHQAVWIEGEHWLHFEQNNLLAAPSARRVVYSVLIWTDEAMTYRLETMLSMEEAIRIAESLR
jgi:hypothetical protein